MRTAGAPALAVALALLSGGCGSGVRIYRVPSGSMEPTLHIGEQVAVTPISSTPRVGQVVVFHPPEAAAEERCGRPAAHGAMCSQPVPKESRVNFVKRIVAGPGDEIYMKEGHVFRRAAGSAGFAPEPDPYASGCGGTPHCAFPKPITVPAGHWFLLGDNRGESDDSRFWGPVPTAWLVGQVRLF